MQDGRRKTRQRRSYGKQTVAAGLLLALAALLSFVLSVALLPHATTIGSLPLNYIQQQHVRDLEEDTPCPYYGCPIYPLEIDDASVQEALLRMKDFHFGTPNFAVITRQSNEHSFNQDKAVIIRPFVTQQSAAGDDSDSFLVGIFDGHGEDGHVVAANAVGMLPALLARKLNERPFGQTDAWIQQQLNETFLQVNQELPPFSALRGGCTASVTLRLGSKLFVANAGDSRTILVHRNPKDDVVAAAVDIPYLSRFDKAHLPDERARIEGLGGNIHIPPDHPSGARVVVYSASAKPPEPIGLAMSRSLGDWEWKEVGVTAEPIVDVIDLSDYFPVSAVAPSALFLLAASDGVWDMRVKPEFFARRVSERISSDGPLKTVVDVILDVSPAKKEWYRDDMTLLYVAID